MKPVVVYLTVLMLHIHVTGDEYEYQLVNDLFQNYSPKARPSLNHSQSTKIYISVALSQIINLDERNQMITVYIWITMYWFDPMLVWNPRLYNNITSIVLPASDVWKPDISMNDPGEKIIVNNDYENVRIDNAGFVQWLPNGAFTLYCKINAEYFPFDEQNCSLCFMAQSYSLYQVEFVIYSNLIMNYYVNNTDWDFINATATKHSYTEGPYPMQDVTFYFLIRRKPFFHVIKLILPCVITLSVSFLAFFVPASSGEKMSISVTSLLSALVLLLVVTNILPPSADSFPIIGLFYTTTIGVNALISLTSVFILNIHHYGENRKPVPRILQRVFFSLFGKIILFPKIIHFNAIRSSVLNEQPKAIEIKNTNTDCAQSHKFCCTNIFRSNKIACSSLAVSDQIDKEQAQAQWTLLADVLERLLFYIILLVTVLSLLGILAKAPNARINI